MMNEGKGHNRLFRVLEAIRLILWPMICGRGCFLAYDENLVRQDDGSYSRLYYHTVVVWSNNKGLSVRDE